MLAQAGSQEGELAAKKVNWMTSKTFLSTKMYDLKNTQPIDKTRFKQISSFKHQEL